MASLRRPDRSKTNEKKSAKSALSGGDLSPLRPQRRPRMMALGAALVVVAGLGGVALAQNLSDSYQVVAVGRDVPRGEAITPQDLINVEIPNGSTGLDTIPSSQASSLVGKLATSDLHAGTTLSPDSVASTLGVQSGHALVGIALSPSKVPASTLESGDSVTLVQVAAAGSASIENPQTWYGTVVAVHTSPSDSSVQIIDVQVAEDSAAQVASLASSDQIALILNSQD